MKIFLFDLCVHKIDIMIDSNEMQSLEESCQKILGLPKIRFVGVLNKMGNRIAGGFKKGIVSYLPDKESRTMYVELALKYFRNNFTISLNHSIIRKSQTKRTGVIMGIIIKYQFIIQS